jgi:tRNA A-37 threonylcarbamoyl transferase component Bud32
VKLQVASKKDFPTGLVLPWERPLRDWDAQSLVTISHGLSRNIVRFVRYRDVVYAIKEISERLAVREYGLLRQLEDMGLPVVQAVSVVTERHNLPGAGSRVLDRGLLVTRYLDRSLPLRRLITSGASAGQARNLMDAVAELLVRLHLAGFFWGDCSLSNTLFRLDAGLYAAYLVDAETGELHETLSRGQRRHDLDIATENLAGELLDLDAGFGLPEGVDPIDTAMSVEGRYQALWEEITRDEKFSPDEQFRIDARIRRLNQLGYDVDELEIETLPDGRLRVHADVVEAGHHRRLVRSLTGLEVQENQARRLLNDMYSFRAWQTGVQGQDIPETISAFRWFAEVYRPTLDAIPPEYRAKLDEAEIFHQLLEHRWYMSEREGREVSLDEVIPSYVEEVLARLPEPEVATSPLTVSE